MALALEDFEALAGFAPVEDMKDKMRKHGELVACCGDAAEDFMKAQGEEEAKQVSGSSGRGEEARVGEGEEERGEGRGEMEQGEGGAEQRARGGGQGEGGQSGRQGGGTKRRAWGGGWRRRRRGGAG